jgi:hypothetical protein
LGVLKTRVLRGFFHALKSFRPPFRPPFFGLGMVKKPAFSLAHRVGIEYFVLRGVLGRPATVGAAMILPYC